MIGTWTSAPDDLQLLKIDILEATGLGRDALHVYVGLAVFVIVRLIWRRRGGWWLAWTASLAVALGIEWLDMRADATGSAVQPDTGHWHDIWNTMFWPTILLLIGRWLQPKAKVRPESGDLADEPLEEPPPV
jgi:hypothetical protein